MAVAGVELGPNGEVWKSRFNPSPQSFSQDVGSDSCKRLQLVAGIITLDCNLDPMQVFDSVNVAVTKERASKFPRKPFFWRGV